MMRLLLLVGMAICMIGIAKAELLPNTSFEDNGGSIDGWSRWSGGSGSGTGGYFWIGDWAWVNTVQDGTAHSGDTYVEHGIWFENDWSTWGWGVSLVFKDVPVVTGDTYTFSAWFRDGWSDPANPGTGTIPSALTIEQRWWDGVSSGRPPEVDLDGSGSTNDDRVNVPSDIPQDGQWHFRTMTHTIPEGINFITAVISTWTRNTNLDIDDASLKPHNTHNPQPADGGNAPETLDTLSWDNPDPNNPGDTITCDVYFAADYREAGMYEGDPNFLNYAQLIADDERSTSVSIPEPLTFGQTYYWRVDCTDPGTGQTIVGHIWEFTVSNFAPAVDAGEDVHTWLTDGSAVVNLDATATDDGHPDPPATYSLSWAVTAGDAGSIDIADPTVEDAEVTVTAVGTYTLQLTANDSELSGSDTVVINVYETACDATKGAGIELPATDMNQDCAVNMADLAELAANLFRCMSYDCL